jgi:hypothetical protein
MCFFLGISMAGSAIVQAQAVQAPTIADAARQERERRKALESETSNSIPAVTSVTPVPATGSTATTRPRSTTGNQKPKSTVVTDLQGHDEKYWRPKFDAARLAVKRAEDNLKRLDPKVADQNPPLVNRSSTTAVQKATNDRNTARKALAEAQQKFADLEEQLRRAGGPSGWSRPL